MKVQTKKKSQIKKAKDLSCKFFLKSTQNNFKSLFNYIRFSEFIFKCPLNN